jgi:AhpC/TSA family
MTEPNFTFIDEGRIVPVPATVNGDHVRLSPATLRDALGWELKPQGLCKDERCMPIGGHADLVTDDGIDLAGLAALLTRPLAVDTECRAAYLGAAAADRAAQLASLQAPDFTLPDLHGQLHSLSDYRGKKVLLVAYASW